MIKKDETTILNSDPQFQELEKNYARAIKREEKVKELIADIKEQMMQKMKGNSINKYKDDKFTISYMPEKAGKRFNGSLLKIESPKIYAKYQVETVIPEVLRISISKG